MFILIDRSEQLEMDSEHTEIEKGTNIKETKKRET